MLAGHSFENGGDMAYVLAALLGDRAKPIEESRAGDNFCYHKHSYNPRLWSDGPCGGAAAIVVLAATDAAVSIKVGCDENVLVHPSLEYEELMKKYKDPIDPKVLLLPKM
ncbi:unnamed protein product [Umbelopsis vinacea]